MNHFRFNSYLPTLSSISDVVKQMELLQSELESSDLQNLRFFNRTYLLITVAVQNKLAIKYFDDDQRMIAFDIAFAKYYFDALREYCQNKQIAPAWRQCFESARSKKLPHTIFMALGINAHVNNDLPFVLHDCQFGSEYKSDFQKINTVIAQQLHDVFNSLHETNIFFKILILFQIIYFPILNATIGKWRSNAWNNYEKFLKGEINKNKIEHEAGLVGQFLLKLS